MAERRLSLELIATVELASERWIVENHSERGPRKEESRSERTGRPLKRLGTVRGEPWDLSFVIYMKLQGKPA